MSVIFNPARRAGLLNDMLLEEDDRPAAVQFNERYAHGGGWRPLDKAKAKKQPDGYYRMLYEGDPALAEIARAQLRDELIILFEAEFVGIIQPDGSSEIARMD